MIAEPATPLSRDDLIRVYVRGYLRREGIGQVDYAKRLGLSQAHVSRFLVGHMGFSLRIAQAMYRLHPELRPSLHAAVFGADAVAQTDAGEQVPA